MEVIYSRSALRSRSLPKGEEVWELRVVGDRNPRPIAISGLLSSSEIWGGMKKGFSGYYRCVVVMRNLPEAGFMIAVKLRKPR